MSAGKFSTDAEAPNERPLNYETEQYGDTPMYGETIVSKIRTAKHESDGINEFLPNLLEILCGSVVCMTLCLFCAGLTAVIPISMIVIGAIYKDECPTQPYIPLCLIVTGSFSFLTCFTCVFGCLSKRRKTSDRTHDVSCRHGISGLLFICLICSYIAGDVWIFKAYEPSYEDPSAPDYCDKTLYLFSCWMMNISFLLVGFGGCISALVGWWVG